MGNEDFPAPLRSWLWPLDPTAFAATPLQLQITGILDARENLKGLGCPPGTNLRNLLLSLADPGDESQLRQANQLLPHIKLILKHYYGCTESVVSALHGDSFPSNLKNVCLTLYTTASPLCVPMLREELEEIFVESGCPRGVRPEWYFYCFQHWESKTIPLETALEAYLGGTLPVINRRADHDQIPGELKAKLQIPAGLPLSYQDIAFASVEAVRRGGGEDVIKAANVVLSKILGVQDPTNYPRAELWKEYLECAMEGDPSGVFVVTSRQCNTLSVAESDLYTRPISEEMASSMREPSITIFSRQSGMDRFRIGSERSSGIHSTTKEYSDFLTVADYQFLQSLSRLSFQSQSQTAQFQSQESKRSSRAAAVKGFLSAKKAK